MKWLVLVMLILSPIFDIEARPRKSKKTSFQKMFEKNKRRFEIFQSEVSTRWRSMNEDVDKFFASDNYEDEINESYIRASLVFELEESENFGTEFDLKMQTDFPNASKNVKLIIQKERDELREGGRISDVGSRASNNEAEDNRYSAAGRLNWVRNKRWQVFTDVGFRFDVPLDPFVKLRVRRRFKFRRAKLDLIQRVEYFRINELSHETIAEYLKRINRRFKFKFVNSLSYKRIDRFYKFYNTMAILHRMKRTTSFAYSVTAEGASEPAISYNNYIQSNLMRRLIHKDWLFLQLELGVNFPREEEFESRGFAILGFEVFF